MATVSDEVGELWLRQVHEAGRGVLYVDLAPPRVEISGVVLRQIAADASCPLATYRKDVIRIEGVNGAVVYRLVRYDADRDVWLAEWPD